MSEPQSFGWVGERNGRWLNKYDDLMSTTKDPGRAWVFPTWDRPESFALPQGTRVVRLVSGDDYDAKVAECERQTARAERAEVLLDFARGMLANARPPSDLGLNGHDEWLLERIVLLADIEATAAKGGG